MSLLDLDFNLLFKVLSLFCFLQVLYLVAVEVNWNVGHEVNYDYRFHACFAKSLDSQACNANYVNYAPLVFLPINFLVVWLNFPLWLAFFVLWALVLGGFSILLIRHSGFFGFFSFFFLFNFLYQVFHQVNWFYHVRTGFLPFYASLLFGVWLFLGWKELSWSKRILLSLGVLLAHNYGLALLAYLLILKVLGFTTKTNEVVLGLVLTFFLIFKGLFPDRLLILVEILLSLVLGWCVSLLFRELERVYLLRIIKIEKVIK